MNIEIKKNIKILIEKFNHSIEYYKDILIIKNEINEIKIWEEDKYGIKISFNLSNTYKELKVSEELVYDILISIISRKSSNNDIKLKTNLILTINDWVKEEGDFANEQLEKLKNDLKTKLIEYRDLGGNRYKAEFYKGIILLKDDLSFASSNIVHL